LSQCDDQIVRLMIHWDCSVTPQQNYLPCFRIFLKVLSASVQMAE